MKFLDANHLCIESGRGDPNYSLISGDASRFLKISKNYPITNRNETDRKTDRQTDKHFI